MTLNSILILDLYPEVRTEAGYETNPTENRRYEPNPNMKPTLFRKKANPESKVYQQPDPYTTKISELHNSILGGKLALPSLKGKLNPDTRSFNYYQIRNRPKYPAPDLQLWAWIGSSSQLLGKT